LQQVVCAWCKPQRVLRPGRKPATHGICASCQRKYFGDDDARDNPPPRAIQVRQFRSARGHLVSGDVDAISYVHIDSATLTPYRHVFRGTGTELWALADGSLLVRNPNARLWEDLVAEDHW
jgi:hypothetical protein